MPPPPVDRRPVEDVEEQEEDGEDTQEDQVGPREPVRPESATLITQKLTMLKTQP